MRPENVTMLISLLKIFAYFKTLYIRWPHDIIHEIPIIRFTQIRDDLSRIGIFIIIHVHFSYQFSTQRERSATAYE